MTSNAQANADGAVQSQADDRQQDEATLMPPVDVFEDAQGITLLADLPGVRKEELGIRVDSDTLFIEGGVNLSTPDGIRAHHAEVRFARYRRAFTLSKELDAERIEAEFTHGVLKLRIPKAVGAQARRIPVTLR